MILTYPGLRPLKTPFCKATTRYRPKELLLIKKPCKHRTLPTARAASLAKLKATEPFFKSSYE